MSETLSRIVIRLARSGWGALSGREMMGARAALSALAMLLPSGSASGTITALQVAEAAGRSGRRIRDALHLLEDIGVISWSRGGIRDGRPVAGHIRVSKRSLWAMIGPARDAQADRRRQQAAALRARLADIRQTRWLTSTRAQNTLSAHADVTASLLSLREDRAAMVGPVPAQRDDIPTPDRYAGTMPVTCPHGVDTPTHCPLCRRTLIRRDDIQPADLLTAAAPPPPRGPSWSPSQRLRELLARRKGSYTGTPQPPLIPDGPPQ